MEETNIVEDVKVCNRCGRTLPISCYNRVRYKDRQPKYTHGICKDCQSIEQRRRYLLENDPDHPALKTIELLYEKHKAEGRSVPGASRRHTSSVDALVLRLLEGIEGGEANCQESCTDC